MNTQKDLISRNSRFQTIMRLFYACLPLGSKQDRARNKEIAAYTVDDICKKDVITVDDEASVEYIPQDSGGVDATKAARILCPL